MSNVSAFFQSLWDMVLKKHEEGTYNSVYLGLLFSLPLLLLLVCVIICCHSCCHCQSCSCQKQERRRKDDLWISTRVKPVMLERIPSLPVQMPQAIESSRKGVAFVILPTCNIDIPLSEAFPFMSMVNQRLRFSDIASRICTNRFSRCYYIYFRVCLSAIHMHIIV